MKVGVDLGGTKLAVGTLDGPLSLRPTPDTAEGIVAEVRALAGEASGIGVCVAGRVDVSTGQTAAANLPQLDGFPLAGALEQGGVQVALLNDADAAALAEHHLGAASGAHTSLYVTVSTGIGAGLVAAGRLHTGAHGQALELGHVSGGPAGQPCPCGRTGCLELVASGTALTRQARTNLNDPAASPEALAALAAEGDRRVLDPLEAAAQALGERLADACILLDPDVVVLGGGVVGGYGERYLTPLRAALTRALGPWHVPDLRVARLGSRAGVLGAILALEQQA
ncbi:ROK family protein [Deinococcus sonorensis]|uniref:ROK family protein n=2 Tax=Deinococcus sonorensis TaxID=309891 RepID=A0AAU7UF94_9DEIO